MPSSATENGTSSCRLQRWLVHPALRSYLHKNHVWHLRLRKQRRTHDRPCAEASDRARLSTLRLVSGDQGRSKDSSWHERSRASAVRRSLSLGTVRPSICARTTRPEFTAKLGCGLWLARAAGCQTKLYIAYRDSPWSERLQRELQRQTERRVRLFERRDLLHTARYAGGYSSSSGGVLYGYRPTPSCATADYPPPVSETIKPSPWFTQDAPTPGRLCTDGSGSNIGQVVCATGGTSLASPACALAAVLHTTDDAACVRGPGGGLHLLWWCAS